MVNKFFYMIVLAELMSFLPLNAYAGEDVVRAGLFLDYAKKKDSWCLAYCVSYTYDEVQSI